MFRKPQIVAAAGAVSLLFSAPVPAAAVEAVYEVNVVGNRTGGHYYANGNVFRTFAGTYTGDFTSEDCTDAAGRVLNRFRDANETVKLGDAAGVRVPLDRNRRMLILGMSDETDNRWFYVCINLAATLTDSYRYELGNGPFASSGFVHRSATFNGKRYTIKFANSDQPEVGMVFLEG